MRYQHFKPKTIWHDVWRWTKNVVIALGSAILAAVVIFIIVAYHRSFPREVIINGNRYLDTAPGYLDTLIPLGPAGGNDTVILAPGGQAWSR